MVLDEEKRLSRARRFFIDARNMGYMKDRTHRELSCGEETEDTVMTLDGLQKPLNSSVPERWKLKKASPQSQPLRI